MSVAIVTGAGGLIGAEAARFFGAKGMTVVGIDNDMRRYFFGDGASTAWARGDLTRSVKGYVDCEADIRDAAAIDTIFARYGGDITAVIRRILSEIHEAMAERAARRPAAAG